MDYKLIVESIKNQAGLFNSICDYFQIDNEIINFASDTSRSETDIRINFHVNKDWVIKINSKNKLTQSQFVELNKVVENYNSSGIYAPRFIKSKMGKYLYEFRFEGRLFVAWVEENAPFEVSSFNDYSDEIKIEVLKKNARYMSFNSNKDLMSRWSMWSIIELPDWEVEIDEKQQNYLLLRKELSSIKQSNIISIIDEVNQTCRNKIKEVLPHLKKCSIQGDLNASNILIKNNEFMGLIDFNMSGKEVNINNILNETRYTHILSDFENLSAKQIFEKMNSYRDYLLSHVFEYYVLDNFEKSIWNEYRKIVDLFLWPNVSLWIYMIKQNFHVDKVIKLIKLIAES